MFISSCLLFKCIIDYKSLKRSYFCIQKFSFLFISKSNSIYLCESCTEKLVLLYILSGTGKYTEDPCFFFWRSVTHCHISDSRNQYSVSLVWSNTGVDCNVSTLFLGRLVHTLNPRRCHHGGCRAEKFSTFVPPDTLKMHSLVLSVPNFPNYLSLHYERLYFVDDF